MFSDFQPSMTSVSTKTNRYDSDSDFMIQNIMDFPRNAARCTSFGPIDEPPHSIGSWERSVCSRQVTGGVRTCIETTTKVILILGVHVHERVHVIASVRTCTYVRVYVACKYKRRRYYASCIKLMGNYMFVGVSALNTKSTM